MPPALQDITALFSSTTRLYALELPSADTLDLGDTGLLLEAFVAQDSLHSVGTRELIVLSSHPDIDFTTLYGQVARLQISLSDRSRASATGLIVAAARHGSDGKLTRYQLRVAPWLWLLGQTHTSRVWQDKTTVEIIEAVFQDYQAFAAWRWSEEVPSFLRPTRARSYCVQYRETDLAFVTRLLAEEGLTWRFEEEPSAPAGHRLVLFADTHDPQACPEDPSSAHVLGAKWGGGIRYQGARALEEQDGVQALAMRSTLTPARVTQLSYHYETKRSISVSIPTHPSHRPFPAGPHAPQLESYDTPGPGAWASAEEARHYTDCQVQARMSRRSLWQGRSTVRTFTAGAGTRFPLVNSPRKVQVQGHPQDPTFVLLSVTSIGINNLPRPAQENLDQRFGPLAQVLQTCLNGLQTKSDSSADTTSTTSYTLESTPLELLSLDDVLTQAWASGYANRFDAMACNADTPPWRPVLADGTGLYHRPRPTAQGSLSATVVGPNGEVTPRPDQELFTDRLGRIRIKLHFQGQPENLQGDPHGDANASCWVRVVQRSAGGGMGHQFIPRIGQEVLVQFLEGDIDRPIVLAALYNGQGEGGVQPTPGGLQPGNEEASSKVFEAATDHRSSAQGNRIGSGTGGHSPVWHGAAASAGADGQNNASAQWGIRSKEHGGQGYNQLVMDDSDGAGPQGRIQLKTTQAATELNLGHLLHTADNYRGSFRGTGAELRTDAYGALRAGQGWLITSYRIQHSSAQRDPAGDNSAGMALQKQLETLAGTFSQAASTHRSVAFAGHIGTTQANASSINDQAAPHKAQRIAASGMVDGHSLQAALGDAAAKNTQVDTSTDTPKVPHSSAATIAIAAKAGLGVVAGQHIQWANGETASAMSGQDSQYVTGGQLRVHTGQAIGILAGVVQAGPNAAAGAGGLGLQLVAAQDAIDLQAQADTLKVQAKDLINVVSANAHIDWAAAISIEIATAGGANVTISSAGVKHTAPGMILVKAGDKVFVGPGSVRYSMPQLPRVAVENIPVKFDLTLSDVPGPYSTPLALTDWRIVQARDATQALQVSRSVLNGTSDTNGKIVLTADQEKLLLQAYNQQPAMVWIVADSHAHNLSLIVKREDWTDQQQQKQALDAMGYSDDLGTVGHDGDSVDDFHAKIARNDTKTQTGKALFTKIKKN